MKATKKLERTTMEKDGKTKTEKGATRTKPLEQFSKKKSMNEN